MVKKLRIAIQAAAALLQNANLRGFFKGEIYGGSLKNICVPGLNCYSCPGALGSCPIGSLQSSLGAMRFRFPYYVVGLLVFFGALLGRFVCGFLCPFGLLQDLLHKIPFPKKLGTFRGDKFLRGLKYIILITFVIVLPLSAKLIPYFCKYICPSGTLSGILLALSDTKLFRLFGSGFALKAAILALIILLSVLIFRPFCKYICPLGAFYAPFNKFALVRMDADKSRCVGCGACSKACRMGIDPSKQPNSLECIRCGECIDACGFDALRYCTVFKKAETKTGTSERIASPEKQTDTD